jgi:hypothetical protein
LPSFGSVATLIVAAVAGALGDGLAAAALGDGLAAAVVGDELPHAAVNNAMIAAAVVIRVFDCIGMLLRSFPAMHPDTEAGYV